MTSVKQVDMIQVSAKGVAKENRVESTRKLWETLHRRNQNLAISASQRMVFYPPLVPEAAAPTGCHP